MIAAIDSSGYVAMEHKDIKLGMHLIKVNDTIVDVLSPAIIAKELQKAKKEGEHTLVFK